jgi:hypothetical protein
MTKAEHKQRAMDMAYQVRRCYSRPAKNKMAKHCLTNLRESLKMQEGATYEQVD